MIRLTRHGTEITATNDELTQARVGFARDYAIHLPKVLDSEDLAFMQRQIERDGFHERVTNNLPSRPVDLGLNDGAASGALALMLNDARVIEFARQVTGIDTIHASAASRTGAYQEPDTATTGTTI